PLSSWPGLTPGHDASGGESFAAFPATLTLNRHCALDDDAVHLAPRALGVVGIRLVHGAAIVPDEDIALLPAMAVLEARLGCVRDELVEKRIALAPLEPDDLLDAVGIEVERFLARLGVGAHDGMDGARHGRRLGLRQGLDARPLAA